MTSGKSNNQLAKIAGYLFPVFLTILFLFFAFKGIDLTKSFDLISHSSLIWIFIYFVVFLASHLARAIRWKYMIDSVKKDVSMFHLFGSVMVSYGISCVIPRLGELYRGLFLGRWEGISRSTVIGTIIVERIIDIAAFAIAALISVAIYSGNLYDKITWLRTSLVIGFGLITAAVIFLVFLVRFRNNFRNGLIKLSSRFGEKTAGRLHEIFDTLINGFSSIKSGKNILMISAWSAGIILLYALNTFVGFYMLEMQFSGEVNFSMAFIVMTIGAFVAMIPTPGGTGSYHWITILVLTQLYRFSDETSGAFAILTHFISYIGFILSTLIIVFIVNRQRVKRGLQKETFLSVFKIHSDEK